MAAVLNVTAIKPAAGGHLRVWGQGPLPTASTLNFTPGAMIGNAALAGFGPSAVLGDGWFGIYVPRQDPPTSSRTSRATSSAAPDAQGPS